MIKVDISRCTGCRMCETACAFYHTADTNRHKSRIKVTHHYSSGVDGPVLCVQCRERPCLPCPVNALSLGDEGQVLVSPTSCILCGKCARNCPVGAIEMFEELIYVCDLCGGEPRCVSACTEGALEFYPDEIGVVTLADYKDGSSGLNPAEKRARFVARQGEVLRRGWGDRP